MNWNKSFRKTWLNLFIVVILIIAIFGLPSLLRLFITKVNKGTLSAAGANSELCLYSCPPPSPATLTESPTAKFSIPVIIDTDNASIRGVDVVINFDTNFLTLTDINPSAQISTTLKTFAPIIANDPKGTFDKTTVISNANSSGSIKFGAATADWNISPTPAPTPTITITSPFIGNTTLAILTFQSKQTGTTNLSFNFTAGSTTDSNLVEATSNNDILASVNNLTLTVANPTPTSTVTSPTPSTTPGVCPFHSSGDLNCDNVINIFDYNIILQDFGCPSRSSPVCASNWNIADANGDNNVNIFDYNILLQHFGHSVTPTPTP